MAASFDRGVRVWRQGYGFVFVEASSRTRSIEVQFRDDWSHSNMRGTRFRRTVEARHPTGNRVHRRRAGRNIEVPNHPLRVTEFGGGGGGSECALDHGFCLRVLHIPCPPPREWCHFCLCPCLRVLVPSAAIVLVCGRVAVCYDW